MNFRTPLKRLVVFLPAIIVVSVFLEACSNKGCTDKEAINFNVVADKDDGSCKYCNSAVIQLGRDSVFIADDNSASSHYLQTVAKVVVTRKKLTYNDSSCGVDECSTTYSVENLTGQDFDLGFVLHCSSTTFFSTSDFVTVEAGQTGNNIEIPQSEISNPCANLFPGTISVFATSTIVYH